MSAVAERGRSAPIRAHPACFFGLLWVSECAIAVYMKLSRAVVRYDNRLIIVSYNILSYLIIKFFEI